MRRSDARSRGDKRTLKIDTWLSKQWDHRIEGATFEATFSWLATAFRAVLTAIPVADADAFFEAQPCAFVFGPFTAFTFQKQETQRPMVFVAAWVAAESPAVVASIVAHEIAHVLGTSGEAEADAVAAAWGFPRLACVVPGGSLRQVLSGSATRTPQ